MEKEGHLGPEQSHHVEQDGDPEGLMRLARPVLVVGHGDLTLPYKIKVTGVNVKSCLPSPYLVTIQVSYRSEWESKVTYLRSLHLQIQ